MLGLITMPILGWNLGTWLGGAISAVLPQALQNAMGIALYAMFIALIRRRHANRGRCAASSFWQL